MIGFAGTDPKPFNRAVKMDMENPRMLPDDDEAAEVRVITDVEWRMQGDLVIFVPFSEIFQLDVHKREISWYYPVTMCRWFTLP